MKEFDVWSDDRGRLTATEAAHPFPEDMHAPYSYTKHQWRVTAASGRAALREYRAQMRKMAS